MVWICPAAGGLHVPRTPCGIFVNRRKIPLMGQADADQEFEVARSQKAVRQPGVEWNCGCGVRLPASSIQLERDSGFQVCPDGRVVQRRRRGSGRGVPRQALLRGEGGGVFVWGLPADARTRAVDVAVRAPVGQRGAGMGQRRDRVSFSTSCRCRATA